MASGQNSALSSNSPACSGTFTVMATVPASWSRSAVTQRSRSSGVSSMPRAPAGLVERAASSFARSRTVSSNRRGGASSSTSRHSTAVRPLTPSGRVAKTSARSLRVPRLSTTRVSPPVPGSTPSSGTSGSATVEELSSTRTMWSQARASS